jgi:spiro-SPASM protein
MPAAIGFGAALIHTTLLGRLVEAKTHAGRLLHYHPDQLSRESLATENCVPIPAAVARSTTRFTLESDRQVQRMTAAMEPLDGQLISSSAEEIVRRARAHQAPDPLPREIVLELNTNRSTSPVFWPGSALSITRPDLSLDDAKHLFTELSLLDDTRLTLAGIGDPLLSPDVFAIIDAAKSEGRLNVHIETDLHEVSAEQIARLAACPVDVISIHLPALSQATYASVMGCDGYPRVLDNIRQLISDRHARGSLLPIIVPVFTKCRHNFSEMEMWYDHWIRTIGSAVIRGPSDFCGQIPDVAVADMAPSGRKPCHRIASRLTILSDGRVVSCEQDAGGANEMGQIGKNTLRAIWQREFGLLRRDHQQGKWTTNSLCEKCREWHRP